MQNIYWSGQHIAYFELLGFSPQHFKCRFKRCNGIILQSLPNNQYVIQNTTTQQILTIDGEYIERPDGTADLSLDIHPKRKSNLTRSAPTMQSPFTLNGRQFLRGSQG